MKKYRTVIFVNGCFWHMHDCELFRWPKANLEYWKPKINGNAERDKRNYELLRKQGWKVIVVWECELKKQFLEDTIDRLVQEIRNQSTKHNNAEENTNGCS